MLGQQESWGLSAATDKSPANCFSRPLRRHGINQFAGAHAPGPCVPYFMYLNRNVVRRFVDAVDWVTPRNIIILLLGKYDTDARENQVIRNELVKMTKTVREPPLKRLPCDGRAIYASSYTRKKDLGSFKLAHDEKLRDCLAKYFHGK